MMETIQDILREEARDYQELAAMAHKRVVRIKSQHRRWRYHGIERLLSAESDCAGLSHIARSALLELIGAEPE